MICTAHSKRTGAPCKAAAITGGHLCRMHGGTTPVGLALPQFKHGRYSKYLPTRLLSRYHAAQDDPTLLELHAEIALLDARLADVLGRVETGESGALWGHLAAAKEALRAAQRAKDLAAQGAALSTILDLISQGAADYAAWGEVQRLIQQRKALVESERKHRVEEQQMVRVEQAMVLVAALAESVRRHVSDPRALAAIQTDILRLTGGPAGDLVDSAATAAGE